MTKSEFKKIFGEDPEDVFGGGMEDYGIVDDASESFCPNCKSIDLIDTCENWTQCRDCGFSFVS